MIIEARDDVVKLEGGLDKNLWPTIQAAANLLLRQNLRGIIVDAGELTGCSPEGAKTFRDAMDYIERYKARIVVCRVPPAVMDVVKTVPGVRSRLPIAATLEEARASLSLARSTAAPPGPAGARAIQSILVPLLRGDGSDAISLACLLAKGNRDKARLHLAYVLEVPRHLPLTAPLPEEEAAAARALETAEKAIRREGLTVTPHVRRARDAGEDIVLHAEELAVGLIVLAYLPVEDPADDLMRRAVRTVFERAPCEVVLNKQPV